MRILLLLLPLLSFACIDNSGGEAPSGTDLSLSAAGPSIGTCTDFSGDAIALLDSEAAIDTWLSGCPNEAAAISAALVPVLDELADGERLVAIRIGLGGCVQDWHLRGLFLDATTINAWALKADTAFGRGEQPCTDDIGVDERYVIAGGAAAAREAKLTIGRYNPDLPGAPLLPGE